MSERHKLRISLAIALLRSIGPDEFSLGSHDRKSVTWLLELFPHTVGWDETTGLFLLSSPQERLTFEELCAEVFGLSRSTALGLFSPGAQYTVHPALPLCYRETGPDVFADMLEEYLELETSDLPSYRPNRFRSYLAPCRLRAV